MKSINIYRMPVSPKFFPKKSRKSPAHKGKLKHSVDFIIPEGSSVYAALSGTVVFVKQDSKVGGPDKKYWSKGNRIVILHKNGEYSAYEHLRYMSSKVKKWQKVRTGQIIGYSGNTGYSFGPHLHFEVFSKPNKEESEGTTLRISFL